MKLLEPPSLVQEPILVAAASVEVTVDAQPQSLAQRLKLGHSRLL